MTQTTIGELILEPPKSTLVRINGDPAKDDPIFICSSLEQLEAIALAAIRKAGK